jgi:hypothetical protein
MSWRTPTTDDLLEVLSGSELEAYRAAALADGQSDPAEARIASVTALVRGYIAVVSSLGAAGTLPEALIPPAMDYLAVDVLRRLPGVAVDESRSQARKDAIAIFQSVARGEFAIETPEEVDETEFQAPAPDITEPATDFHASEQEGI